MRRPPRPPHRRNAALPSSAAPWTATSGRLGSGLLAERRAAAVSDARWGAPEQTGGEPGRFRRLTPRECARLMGFPGSFRIPVSDTRAYGLFGNTVVVPVVTAIATVMRQYLEGMTPMPIPRVRAALAALDSERPEPDGDEIA